MLQKEENWKNVKNYIENVLRIKKWENMERHLEVIRKRFQGGRRFPRGEFFSELNVAHTIAVTTQ